MKKRKESLRRYMVACLCLVSSVVFIGCGAQNKASTEKARKFFSMSLNLQPEYQPLLTGRPQTRGMRAGRVYLKPRQECGSHSTEAHEEMLTFLEGKGTALIGKEKTADEVGQGKICYIPPHTLHNIKNTGTEPLVYIYCVAPVNDKYEQSHAEKDHSH
jgi:mannose-6-phosphate isomerase-like protein (cupin superfamily)